MTTDVELEITGMTCASCANRIERRLNKLDGVDATVNYATEKATVDFDGDQVAPEALLGAVEAAGYQASLPSTGEPAEGEVAFEADLEPDTRYHLYLQFQDEGVVHTAEFTR